MPNGTLNFDSFDLGQWRVWQLIDSAFPAGGFAHSSGMEAAWQAGGIADSNALGAFLEESLVQVASGSVPFVTAACEGRDIAQLDQLLDAMLTNHVANRASRLQGRAFLATASTIWELEGLVALGPIKHGAVPGHFAVVFGAVMRVLGIGAPLACRMFLFVSLRGIVSAAVRLGIVGPLEGQRIQSMLGPHLDHLVDLAAGRTVEDACQTSPLLEIWQMGQDRLYSRLFQS
jgi:urease accessory protein